MIESVILFVVTSVIAFVMWCRYKAHTKNEMNQQNAVDKQQKRKYWYLCGASISASIAITCLLHISYTASDLGVIKLAVRSVFSAVDTIGIFIGVFTAITAFAIFRIQENRAEIEGAEEDRRTRLFQQKLRAYYMIQLQADIQVKNDDCFIMLNTYTYKINTKTAQNKSNYS